MSKTGHINMKFWTEMRNSWYLQLAVSFCSLKMSIRETRSLKANKRPYLIKKKTSTVFSWFAISHLIYMIVLWGVFLSWVALNGPCPLPTVPVECWWKALSLKSGRGQWLYTHKTACLCTTSGTPLLRECVLSWCSAQCYSPITNIGLNTLSLLCYHVHNLFYVKWLELSLLGFLSIWKGIFIWSFISVFFYQNFIRILEETYKVLCGHWD